MSDDQQPRTRLRLPAPADPAGVSPDDASLRRRNPLLSGLGVLIVLAVLVGAVIIASRRSDDPPKDSGATSGATAGENTGSTAKQIDAGPGTPPRTTVAGVGTGYARTKEGAAAAAANYTVVYGSAEMFLAGDRRAIITAISDPAARTTLQQRADQAFGGQTNAFGLNTRGEAPKGLTFVCRALPVGTKSVTYTDTAATVEVWSAGIVGLAGPGSTKPVTEAWSTTTMRLSWTGDDWKLVDFSQKDGPTPVSGLQPASGAEEIAKAAQEFEVLRYAR